MKLGPIQIGGGGGGGVEAPPQPRPAAEAPRPSDGGAFNPTPTQEVASGLTGFSQADAPQEGLQALASSTPPETAAEASARMTNYMKERGAVTDAKGNALPPTSEVSEPAVVTQAREVAAQAEQSPKPPLTSRERSANMNNLLRKAGALKGPEAETTAPVTQVEVSAPLSGTPDVDLGAAQGRVDGLNKLQNDLSVVDERVDEGLTQFKASQLPDRPDVAPVNFADITRDVDAKEAQAPVAATEAPVEQLVPPPIAPEALPPVIPAPENPIPLAATPVEVLANTTPSGEIPARPEPEAPTPPSSESSPAAPTTPPAEASGGGTPPPPPEAPAGGSVGETPENNAIGGTGSAEATPASSDDTQTDATSTPDQNAVARETVRTQSKAGGEQPADPYEEFIAAHQDMSPEQLQRRIEGLDKFIAQQNRRLDRANLGELAQLEALIDSAEVQKGALQELQDDKGGPPEGSNRGGGRKTRQELVEDKARRISARQDRFEELQGLSTDGLKSEKGRLAANIKFLEKSKAGTSDRDEQALYEDLIQNAKADQAAINELVSEKTPLEAEDKLRLDKEEADRLRRETGSVADIQGEIDQLQVDIGALDLQNPRDLEQLNTARKNLVLEKTALKAAQKREGQEQGKMSKTEYDAAADDEKARELARRARNKDPNGPDFKYDTSQSVLLEDKIISSKNVTVEDLATYADVVGEKLITSGGKGMDWKRFNVVAAKYPEIGVAVMNQLAASERAKAIQEKYPSLWKKLKDGKYNKGLLMLLIALTAGLVGVIGPVGTLTGVAHAAAR
ncbi:MAG: hypothetical protein WD988_02080 [Candidatus Curtissbacteria bacterium]